MILTHAKMATLTDPLDYGLIENGALVARGDRIVWVGSANSIPAQYANLERIDLEGRLVTPGLIDCHTHLVFGGNRASEFEMRLNGASYSDIARAGGGIVSTVMATRQTSEADLLASALKRVDALMSEGVCQIEIKSGYGLDQETELKMLRVARAIPKHRKLDVKTTYLGAHALPPEYKDRKDLYIDEVCIPTLNAAFENDLIDAVDGFCESIAFDSDQIARVFKVAKHLNIPVKLHAEQLSNCGGTKLVCQYKGFSADHLEYADISDVKALKESGSVAVLLPGAFYTLKETQKPPIHAFRDYQVPIAIATDCNPGSSPLTSPLLTMNMACTLFELTPFEALKGMTVNAAKALGVSDCGQIIEGQLANLAIWDVDHPAELAYRIGFNPLHGRIFEGIYYD